MPNHTAAPSVPNQLKSKGGNVRGLSSLDVGESVETRRQAFPNRPSVLTSRALSRTKEGMAVESRSKKKLITFHCDRLLISFQIPQLFLLDGAEEFVDFGLHASVCHDQFREERGFGIGQASDLFLAHRTTTDCEELFSGDSELCHQRIETLPLPRH
jgi:hypothetical protein